MPKSIQKPLLEFKDVSFSYDSNFFNLLKTSFSIFKNEHICIIGFNGSGKSTLAKLIAGLLKPTSGCIIFKNQIMTKANIKKLKSSSSIIFENPNNQFIGLSVEDEIAFSLENKCISHEKMQDIINSISDKLGIKNILKTNIKDLSGGQKQLVALASILVLDPEIIVFDEATSMMDGQSKSKIHEIIKILKNKYNKTIVTITHNMEDAINADRIFYLQNGSIVCQDNPKHFFLKNKMHVNKPFIFELAQKLKLKSSKLDDLVKEICHVK